MATKDLVRGEADLSAERTFTEPRDICGKFNLSIAGTWVGTVTVQRKFNSDDDITGEATATTADKLVDSTKTFSTDGVRAGDWVHNTTDDTHAMITAVDSETTLSINGDIMADEEAYVIQRWIDLAESGTFTANADAVGEEVEGGVQYRAGFKDAEYTSGTAHVRISK